MRMCVIFRQSVSVHCTSTFRSQIHPNERRFNYYSLKTL